MNKNTKMHFDMLHTLTATAAGFDTSHCTLYYGSHYNSIGLALILDNGRRTLYYTVYNGDLPHSPSRV